MKLEAGLHANITPKTINQINQDLALLCFGSPGLGLKMWAEDLPRKPGIPRTTPRMMILKKNQTIIGHSLPLGSDPKDDMMLCLVCSTIVKLPSYRRSVWETNGSEELKGSISPDIHRAIGKGCPKEARVRMGLYLLIIGVIKDDWSSWFKMLFKKVSKSALSADLRFSSSRV